MQLKSEQTGSSSFCMAPWRNMRLLRAWVRSKRAGFSLKAALQSRQAQVLDAQALYQRAEEELKLAHAQFHRARSYADSISAQVGRR